MLHKETDWCDCIEHYELGLRAYIVTGVCMISSVICIVISRWLFFGELKNSFFQFVQRIHFMKYKRLLKALDNLTLFFPVGVFERILGF